MSTADTTTEAFADTRPATADDLPDYAPIPRPAFGPALNEQGYYVGRVERNLYWVTDGTYQSAFLTTSDGVVLLDAPPTIGHNIQRAVDEIASANGVSNKVTHLVYSHHHADHAGASSLFDGGVARIGHEETRNLLVRDDDPARPAPEETFQDHRTLEIGGERIELAWHGTNHSPDNIFIHLPDHDALMLVDIVNPGLAPFYQSTLTEDVQGYIAAPATALTYRWKHFIGGHMGRLGTRDANAAPQPEMAPIPRRPPAVHGRHRRQLQDGPRHRGSHPVLRQVRREHLGRRPRLPRRGHRRRRDTGHREVHRRPGLRRRLHRQHHVPRHAIDPPRPRLRLPGPPVSTAVGIIGAGRLGQAMARTALRARREVVLANSRSPESLTSEIAALGDGATAGTVEQD